MKKAEEQMTCSSAKLLLTAISLWRTLRQSRKGLCKTYLAFHATFDTIIIAVDERQKKHPSFSF